MKDSLWFPQCMLFCFIVFVLFLSMEWETFKHIGLFFFLNSNTSVFSSHKERNYKPVVRAQEKALFLHGMFQVVSCSRRWPLPT